MDKPYILHLFTPDKNASPFDVNMAYDAGWSACTPYISVATDEVQALVQDAIFSRGPKGVKRTGIFFGGRDIHQAMDMMEVARESMVPPFEVSLFADPSGAFTTAAGMVACVEAYLKQDGGAGFDGTRVLMFGGTGPVGSAAAMLAAQEGADVVLISHGNLNRAQSAVDLCRERYGAELTAAKASDPDEINALVADADVVFNAAAAGVQVLGGDNLARAARLRVACDVNAVPPEGIAGVGVNDDRKPIEGSPSGAVGIGALTVGNVKYQAQHSLLKQMYEAGSPQYLDFRQAFEVARHHVG